MTTQALLHIMEKLNYKKNSFKWDHYSFWRKHVEPTLQLEKNKTKQKQSSIKVEGDWLVKLKLPSTLVIHTLVSLSLSLYIIVLLWISVSWFGTDMSPNTWAFLCLFPGIWSSLSLSLTPTRKFSSVSSLLYSFCF